MPRPKPAFRLHPGPGRWIINALKVNGPPKKMRKTPSTTKKISIPRFFLLIYHQVGPNPLRHSPKRTRTVILAKKNLDNRAKAKIPLPLVSMPLLSGKTWIRIRIRRTSPTLSATLVSRRAITPTNALKKKQKTSVGLNNLTSMTDDSKEAILVSVKELEQVTCIQYLIAFPGDVTQNGSALDPMSALLNSGSEVNVMHLAFVERLGLVVQVTNIGA